MKTEALRAIANDLKYNTGLIHSNIQLLIEESFISGVKYGQSFPKIKQLEWMISEGGETMLANIPFNDYYLIDGTDGMIFLTINNQHHMEIYDTIDEAKAAAQADFEKRVTECLDL